MKVVILAGGRGTRISEETDVKPKPMIEIGGQPILWHIMKLYAHFGFSDFVVCLGYKGYLIKEYFANYFLHQADVTIDLGRNSVKIHQSKAEDWRVTLIDTGLSTMTGGRLRRIRDYVRDETFMLTYGDGLADLDLRGLAAHHRSRGKLATVTAVQNLGRFGALGLGEDDTVRSFREKPRGDRFWISGGFFVLEPTVFDYLADDDACVWEREPLDRLAAAGELTAFRHEGFWKPMDHLRDKIELDELWETKRAPWAVWLS